MTTRTCPPCTGDCNQGRNCPSQYTVVFEEPPPSGAYIDFNKAEHRPVEGAGIVWAVVCGVPLFAALVALVAAVWPR